MARRSSVCGICEGVNLPAVCANCCNIRLSEKYKILKRVHQHRDDVKRRLEAQLAAKREAESQRKWRAEHAERKAKLREQLRNCSNDLMKAKARGEEQKKRLDARTNVLELASNELTTRQRDTLGKSYPDLMCTKNLSYDSIYAELTQKRRLQLRQLCKILPIRRCTGDEREGREGSGQPVRVCNVQLPIGDDPTSVSHNDLGAALGYMVQLLNLTARYLSAPLLHSAGFAASSSRVWQRASYWDTRPTHRGEEYPLFLPRENGATAEELGHSSSSHCNLGLSFTEGSRSINREMDVDASLVRCSSSAGSSSSSRENYKDVQKGIKMLNRSVACVNAYGYNLLSLQVPSDLSTFESFAELLSILISKEPRPRSSRGSQQPNGRFGLSEGHTSLLASCPSSMLEEVKPVSEILDPSTSSKGKVNSWNIGDFLDIGDSEHTEEGERVSESVFDGWDLVEHPTLPPPPDSEDIEQWARAMFYDATKRSRD